MDARCRIDLFGGLRVAQDSRVITRFQTRQTAAVLAYLAFYRDRPHSRDTLMDVAWPADAGSTDRHKLRVALNSLRRQLEPPGVLAGSVILADRQTVQLNARVVSTDVADFEAALQAAREARGETERAQHLTTAVAQYRGELLPHAFEVWIVPERQRLQEAYLQAVAQLVRHLEQGRDLSRAVEYARRAVAADPLCEESHYELIRLLAAAGQPEAARRQYRELERLLEQELGAEPAAATRELVDTIERERGESERELWCSVSGVGSTVSGLKSSVQTTQVQDPTPTTELLPTGTVTFLLVETEGAGAAEAMPEGLRSLFRGYGGREVPVTAVPIAVTFGRASEALAAAVAGMEYAARIAYSVSEGRPPDMGHGIRYPQCATRTTPRMALDTGEVEPGDPPQRSPALEHATRLLLAAHPGQILLSAKSASLLEPGLAPGWRLRDLGRYHLRAGGTPERVFQAEDPERLQQEFPPLNAAPALVARLPLQLTRFFGREAELEQLRELLLKERRRLVTMTGTGGAGKTRLALALAESLGDAFDALWFVPLADLSDPGLIPEKIREALDLPRLPAVEPLEQVIKFLTSTCFTGRCPVLLVLDNLEQLLPGGAALVGALLQQVENLVLLVTSRQRLGLAGEREFPVGALPVPVEGRWSGTREAGGVDGPAKPSSPEPSTINHLPSTLIQCPSVRLFVDRAQGVRPDFQVTPANTVAVAALCARLEGLPLAIELAAARAQVLTPGQMLARLEQRFELLASRQRAAAPRHQSLWAALDWSYRLLSLALQRFFARLSVFRGGWTVEAAEAVCEEPAALDYLTQLRGYSLVLLEEGVAETRFRLLETLREYGAEQLSPEQRETLAQRHADYHAEFAERADSELRGPAQIEWLDRLVPEQENMRAALVYYSGAPEGAEQGLRLAAALSYFWEVRGYASEGYHWIESLLCLDQGGGSAARARALFGAARLGYSLGHPDTLQRFQESLALFQQQGDRSGFAHALSIISSSGDLVERGGFGSLPALQEKCVGLCREAGNHVALAFVLIKHGNTAWAAGENDRAVALMEEGIALYRRLGGQSAIAFAVGELGYVRTWQAEYQQAEALFDEMLLLSRQVGDRSNTAHALFHLGNLARVRGNYDRAVELLEESVRLRRDAQQRLGVSVSLGGLALALICQGHYSQARLLLEEAMVLTGATERPTGDAWLVVRLAAVLALEGNEEVARSVFEDGLARAREGKDLHSSAAALHGLARLAHRQGDLSNARRLFIESLTIRQRLNDRRGAADCLDGLAAVAAAAGQSETAARWFGAAAAVRDAISAVLPPPERAEVDRGVAAVRAALGEPAFGEAWTPGQTAPLDQVVAEALGEMALPD